MARAALRLKDCPPTKSNKNIILHPLVQLHHLMTKVKMQKSKVNNKRAKVRMTGTTTFKSIMVLMVVKTSQQGIEMRGMKHKINTLNLSIRVQGPLMRALHQVTCGLQQFRMTCNGCLCFRNHQSS